MGRSAPSAVSAAERSEDSCPPTCLAASFGSATMPLTAQSPPNMQVSKISGTRHLHFRRNTSPPRSSSSTPRGPRIHRPETSGKSRCTPVLTSPKFMQTSRLSADSTPAASTRRRITSQSRNRTIPIPRKIPQNSSISRPLDSGRLLLYWYRQGYKLASSRQPTASSHDFKCSFKSNVPLPRSTAGSQMRSNCPHRRLKCFQKCFQLIQRAFKDL